MPLPVIRAESDASSSTESLALRIAGFTIRLTSRDPSLRIGIEGAARRFVLSPADALAATADAALEAHWADLSAETGETLFDSGGVWQLYRGQDGGERFRLFTAEHSDPYRVAIFDESFRHGDVLLDRAVYGSSEEVVHPLEYPLDELLMVHLLAQGAGVEMHSCAVADEQGRGHLFVGVSGAGKTTTARIFERSHRGARVLSDDRNVLRDENGTIVVHGTPWHGEAELSEPSQAPLHRVYLLEQAPLNELVPCSAADAVTRLFTCTFPLFYRAESIDYTLAFLESLAQRVEVVRLRFRPDETMLDAVL
jgi:hypothetical protein